MTAFAFNTTYNRKSIVAVFNDFETLTTREIMVRMGLEINRKSLQKFTLFLRNSMEHSQLKRIKKCEYGTTTQVSFWRKV